MLGKPGPKTPLRVNTGLFQSSKRVVKQAVGGGERNSEIVALPNQYKDTPNDLIDSSDPESPDRAGPIDERSRNALRSESSSADLSEGDCLDEDVPDKSSRLAPKTGDSQVRQRHVVTPRAGYGKSQRGGEDRRRNKINPVVGKSSVYHHVIDRY